MPIEIRELMIKVRVEDQPAASPVGKAAPASLNEKEIQRIIAACTEQVLKILQQQKEK